ncbi:interleukin-1 receptor type 2 [Nerophis lumbriciformis]|uniref:interleukin-1 receptor type 2 n=1 Tax=Nerophis lumbriciformis TaxID=546530 RepID=UPI002ADF958D|nr:interleukin-1 receptor type 2-like [Nerophis lumbriciformis]XP_061782108.1 interleukin-1 receptor type 2-like [Nerophis lumbriciformis]
MAVWALTLALLALALAHGRRPALPAMSLKDGCFTVLPEVELFHMESEVVVVSFPMFRRTLKVRNIAPPTATYRVTKGNASAAAFLDSEGRVQQRGTDLWLLPSQVSDSGDYTCTFRNASYCVRGSVTLTVYATSSVDVHKLSYQYNVTAGHDVTLRCPSRNHFDRTALRIEWQADSAPGRLQDAQRWRSFRQDGGNLFILAVKPSDAGLYTCRLGVTVDNRKYSASRLFQLLVQGSELVPTHMEVDQTSVVTSDPSSPTVRRTPPLIISPANRTILEAAHGSGLELFCKVVTDCDVMSSTAIFWLVNGLQVESSYLDGRALQGGRKESMTASGCQAESRLIVVAMTDEDAEAELRCVAHNRGGRQEVVVRLQLEDATPTWTAVSVVATSCFLAVVVVFLCVLLRPKQKKKKLDYFLARQNSTTYSAED